MMASLVSGLSDMRLGPNSFQLVGLKNPNGKGDNKCFINASLQLLYAIPELHEELSKLTSDSINSLRPAKRINPNTGVITNKNIFGACGPIEKEQIRALKVILEKMRNKEVLDTETVMINGKSVYQLILDFSPDFQYHGQADASTVVNIFLQLFNPYINCQGFDELSRKIFIDKTKNYGKLKSDPTRFVTLRDNEELPILPLQISNPKKATDISELLQDYERPSNIAESNGRIDRFPGNLLIQDKKTIKLHDEQRVVIIQLKRFAFNNKFQEVKLRTVVVPNERITIDSKDFILEGCIIHQGRSTLGGHYVYVSFIDGKINQVINDERISKEQYYINMINTDGYIFLYKRIMADMPSNKTSNLTNLEIAQLMDTGLSYNNIMRGRNSGKVSGKTQKRRSN
jgi:hypothetical protein